MSTIDEACPISATPTPTESASTDILDIDLPCDDKSDHFSARSKNDIEAIIGAGAGDIGTETRRDVGTDPDRPVSLTPLSSRNALEEELDYKTYEKKKYDEKCLDKTSHMSRNPITGSGLNGDGVGGLKPKTPKKYRDGNPVTGEGYKNGHDFNNAVPSLNGAKEVINKNRIPPGGYSSGLW